jgi:hypothetical protein
VIEMNFPIGGLFLTISKLDPEVPIEHEPVRVFFSLYNQTSSSVSGRVFSAFRETGNITNQTVNITDLPAGKNFSGSLMYPTPAVGGSINIFFQKESSLGEFDQEEASVQPEISAMYIIQIDQFHINKTRSLRNDTDYVSLQARVDNQPILIDPEGHDIAWRRMGDVSNGDHPVGLSVGPFKVVPSNKIGWNYQIVNAGYNLEGIKEFLDNVSKAAKGVLEILFIGSDWTEVHELTEFINNKQFANCDGTVALDFILRTGTDLSNLTANTGSFSETRSYPGNNISPTQYEIYRSADGCGETSDYTVTYTIKRVSFR